jgi:hypothetical protein
MLHVFVGHMLTLYIVHVSQNALALPFFTFARNFAQVN